MDIKRWLTKNSSGILSVVACVGVAVTAVLSYKGAIKTQETIKEWTEEKHEELTTVEKVQASAKHVIPAAVAGAATIGCIVGAHKIDQKHVAVLTASAAAMAKKYDDYRKTNIEVNGKEADDRVREKLAVKKAKETHICAESMFQIATLNSELSKEEFLFHDDITDTYFTASLAHVLDAINALNRNFTKGHPEVDVDMWCNFLGIDNTKNDVRGWVLCEECEWIDFDISDPIELEDGMEAIEITPAITPIVGYYNYDYMSDCYDDVINDPEVPF